MLALAIMLATMVLGAIAVVMAVALLPAALFQVYRSWLRARARTVR